MANRIDDTVVAVALGLAVGAIACAATVVASAVALPILGVKALVHGTGYLYHKHRSHNLLHKRKQVFKRITVTKEDNDYTNEHHLKDVKHAYKQVDQRIKLTATKDCARIAGIGLIPIAGLICLVVGRMWESSTVPQNKSLQRRALKTQILNLKKYPPHYAI